MKPLLFLLLLATATSAHSRELKVAVAASFMPSFKLISAAFFKQSGIAINASSASSGQLFAQIKHGADYDIFFSADAQRPAQLRQENPALSPSIVYAYGQLALYSQPAIVCNNWQNALQTSKAENIALANPKLAPFGLAAAEVLDSINIEIKGLPLASNAAAPLNWLYSGTVKHALTAYSFADKLPSNVSTCLLPKNHYQGIEQHLIALNNKPDTLALMHFMHSNIAAKIIRASGYTVSDDD